MNDLSDSKTAQTHISTDEGVEPEPRGYREVQARRGTVGARSGGYFTGGENADQARLRLHDAQVALASLGYLEPGQIDAPWGSVTQDAVVRFEEDHGLAISGQLDSRTYEALLAEFENGLEVESERREGEDRYAPIDASAPLDSRDV